MRSDAFAIYHTWPDLRNAEYEVLQRILGAADRVGKRAVLVDNGGIVLWADPSLKVRKGMLLSPDDVEFAISLHFESPRVCDVYTYYALWQPIEFYADFGYQNSVDKFSTHNDLLSCHSDIADDHALNIFNGMGRPVQTPLPSLFHTLPEPFLTPRISGASSLFYIGINWERIGRPKGRFHDVLTKLDARKVIRIYGPDVIQGVRPWEGFETYSGELPFDGSSILQAINECGICLALSSKAHQNSGIMSNRLFEGLAGGAAVIANPNALIDKYFGDVVYVVDDSRGEAFLEQQIISCLREIRNNPESAMERVRKGQEILRTLCSLERSIEYLFHNTSLRKQNYYSGFRQESTISVVLVAEDADQSSLYSKIKEISEQAFCSISLHLIVSEALARDVEVWARGSIASITVHPFEFHAAPSKFDGREEARGAVGGVIGGILSDASTSYFAIMRMTDMIMRDHFASLARAMEEMPRALCAVSGSLLRTRDFSGREQRCLDELRMAEPDKLLHAEGNIRSGRVLFRSNLFGSQHLPLMRLLDGEEHNLFLLAAAIEGPLAQSNLASHLHDEAAPISIRNFALSVDLQRQLIRDHFNGDIRWSARAGVTAQSLTLSPSSDPRSPGRWVTSRSHDHGSKLLEPNRTVPLRAGELSLNYLVSGFSSPEEEAVWLVGDRGIIEFALPQDAADHIADYKVILGLLGRRDSTTGRMQHCTFVINNLAVAYQAVPDFFTSVSVKIPLNIMRGTNNFRIEIVPDHAEVGRDSSGNVADNRKLSVLVNSLCVTRDADSAPILAINQAHAVTQGELACRSLTAGFYAPERNVTWICGLVGEIDLRIDVPPDDPELYLKLEGRVANHLGTQQEATIMINGRQVDKVKLSSEACPYRIPIMKSDLADVVRVTIQASHAEPVLDGLGNISDPRLLGIGIFEIGIYDKRYTQIARSRLRAAAKPFWRRLMREGRRQ